jgi:hypothetical protein
MAEHKHGSMDITEHQKTYEGFIRWTVRIVVAIFVVLLFLAIFGA